MNRVDGAPCFVLHLRPYRDTSALVDLFSLDHGRFTCVVKGLRGAGRSRQQWRAALQIFNLVAVSWQGRGELKSLLSVQHQQSYSLTGRALFCGFYINELLERLLYRHDPHPDVFLHYTHCLDQLALNAPLEPVLRRFEFNLLASLGYAVNIATCANSHEPVKPDAYYRFDIGEGFFPVLENAPGLVLSGEAILRLAEEKFDGEVLVVAKKLSRQVLRVLLGDKPLQSRALFAAGTISNKPSGATE